jgi:LysM repeat protein
MRISGHFAKKEHGIMKSLLRLSLLVGIIGLVALASVEPVSASAGGWDILGQHTVKVGEQLYCIGRAYGVDPWAIALQNNIAQPSLIHPGDVLDIPNAEDTLPAGPVCTPQFGEAPAEPSPEPAPCGGCSCRWTHVIQWGQTLTWISINYGVDMWSIAECNCITNLNFIRAGASLCIP